MNQEQRELALQEARIRNINSAISVYWRTFEFGSDYSIRIGIELKYIEDMEIMDGSDFSNFVDSVIKHVFFLPTVGKRGAAIIEARGLSSAASAANAAIDHVRDWVLGTNGKWVTMGIASNGEYDIPKDVIYGFPCTCANGKYEMVKGLEIDAFSRERMNLTLQELLEEQDGVKHLLS